MAHTSKNESPQERILGVADRLLYSRGIRAVGIDEIIDRAGVAKATLYRHFSSKEDVVVAYLQQRDARNRAAFAAILSNTRLSPERKVMALFEDLERRVTSDEFRGCTFLMALSEFPESERVRKISVDYKQFVRDVFFRVVADLKNAGRLAEQLTLLYEGAIVHAVFRPGAKPLDHARECARLLISSAEKPLAGRSGGEGKTRKMK